MDSWAKSDSVYYTSADGLSTIDFHIGENDVTLSCKLQDAGPEHCKHLRQIMVWADITAPRLWWNEFDTYRMGVEKVSCSTMHTLMRRPLTEDDFEHDSINNEYMKTIIESLNGSILAYSLVKDPVRKKEIWRGIIEALPQSFLQMRTVMMSYAALRNIVRQRKGHKLKEWKEFIDWAKTLPESWMIFDDKENENEMP